MMLSLEKSFPRRNGGKLADRHCHRHVGDGRSAPGQEVG